MKKWHTNQINNLKNKTKQSQKAFTLIEILIVITIFSMLILTMKFGNFNKISNKHRLEAKVITIVSQIEKIRNDALLGRGIGEDLIVPKSYKITFTTSNSGAIDFFYMKANGDYEEYPFFNKIINFDNNLEIKCYKLNKSENNSNGNGNINIIIKNSKMSLKRGGYCGDDTKIIELSIKRGTENKKIIINILNGLIYTKK